jgi:uncharacterized integral membrane protein (TIGR00698 family)
VSRGVSLGRLGTAVLVVALGSLAYLGGSTIPGINAVVAALVISVILVNVAGDRLKTDDEVTTFLLKRVLKLAVVLLGASISLTAVTQLGIRAFIIICCSVSVAMSISWFFGRRVGLSRRASTLIGVGTGICGASAIAAVAPILDAKKEEIGVALATVFGFNAIALATYPIIGSALGLSQVAFGTWAGIGVHDTASSVATGFAYGVEAGQIATLVKLERTLFLLPLLVIAVFVARKERDEASTKKVIGANFPWFILGFVSLALANTLGWIDGLASPATQIAKTLIVLVVVAIGLTLRWRRISGLGRPLFLTGFVASATVGVLSLTAIQLLGIN